MQIEALRAKQVTYSRIARELQALGWTPIEDPMPSGIAKLEVQTAVGVKFALATEFWPSDKDVVTLNGDYVSEGRNCLSTMFIPVNNDVTDEELREIVKRYDEYARKAISHTYAARLYNNRTATAS